MTEGVKDTPNTCFISNFISSVPTDPVRFGPSGVLEYSHLDDDSTSIDPAAYASFNLSKNSRTCNTVVERIFLRCLCEDKTP